MEITAIYRRIRWAEGVSEITRLRTLNRLRTLAGAIEEQFPQVCRCEQIKLKHMFYLKNVWFDDMDLAPTTRSDYIRAMRLMITALGRDQHWLAPLKLVKNHQHGGRPPVSRVTRSKSRRIRR